MQSNRAAVKAMGGLGNQIIRLSFRSLWSKDCGRGMQIGRHSSALLFSVALELQSHRSFTQSFLESDGGQCGTNEDRISPLTERADVCWTVLFIAMKPQGLNT
jgi:hypothetical protein